MIHVPALGLLVSADNVSAALGLGTLTDCRYRRTRVALAFWFAFFETGMALIGHVLGDAVMIVAPFAGLVGAASLAAVALLVVAGATGWLPLRKPGAAWWLWLLPLCLSFDNLLAGVALAATGADVGQALLVGLLSGVVCLTALTFGQLAVVRLRGHSEFVTRAALVIVATLIALG